MPRYIDDPDNYGRCPRCNGTARVPCPTCDGRRMTLGRKGTLRLRTVDRRWAAKTCDTCHGSGTLSCGCRDGSVYKFPSPG